MNKRILAVVLVLVLMLSMATTSFAAQPSTITTFGGLVEITNVTSEGDPYDDPNYSMDKIEATLGGFTDDARAWENSSLYFADAPVTVTLKKSEDYGIQWYKYYYEGTVEPKATLNKYKTKVYDEDIGEYVEAKASHGTIKLDKPGVYYIYLYTGSPASDDWDTAINLVVGEGTTPATPTTPAQPKPNATPTASTVLVNSISTSFEAYTIEGNNYFKLRDLAQVVNNTEKNFEVEWDGAKNAINLISNAPYTPAGGELAKGDSTSKQAIPTTSTIYKDGVEVKLTAYTIGGNNFFKLRDVAEAFNIGVTWDNATKTVGIDTSIGYVAE